MFHIFPKKKKNVLGESFNKYTTSLHTTQHQYPGNRMEEGGCGCQHNNEVIFSFKDKSNKREQLASLL